MCIYDILQKKLKEAVLNKDEDTKNCIRSIKSKITEYEVSNGLDRNEMPNDKIMVKIILSYKKSLEKAIGQMKSGGITSHEVVDQYNKEIKFCDGFLPNEANVVENIEKIVDKAIEEVGSNMGKVMGYVMKSGSFDGSMVKDIVKKKLGGK